MNRRTDGRTAGVDLYDSQARFYDPVLGRTTTVDPKSGAYAGTSHYGRCAENKMTEVADTFQLGPVCVLCACLGVFEAICQEMRRQST